LEVFWGDNEASSTLVTNLDDVAETFNTNPGGTHTYDHGNTGPNFVTTVLRNSTGALLDSDSASFEFTVLKHITRLNVIAIQDKDTTDTFVPSVPWDHQFNITARLIDLENTGSQTGDLRAKTLTYSGNAFNATANKVFVTGGTNPLPAMATNITELVAAEAFNVSPSPKDFSVVFAEDANYLGSANSTADANVPQVNVTQHHTELFSVLQEDSQRKGKLNVAGILTDLNKTGTTDTVEGRTIALSDDGDGGLGTVPTSTITEGITIIYDDTPRTVFGNITPQVSPPPEIDLCELVAIDDGCEGSPINQLRLGIGSKLLLPAGGSTAALHVQDMGLTAFRLGFFDVDGNNLGKPWYQPVDFELTHFEFGDLPNDGASAYTDFETVQDSTTGNTATVFLKDGGNDFLYVTDATGPFDPEGLVVGLSSGASSNATGGLMSEGIVIPSLGVGPDVRV